MRTREDIEDAWTSDCRTAEEDTAINLKLLLEVALDIRDLLAKSE